MTTLVDTDFFVKKIFATKAGFWSTFCTKRLLVLRMDSHFQLRNLLDLFCFNLFFISIELFVLQGLLQFVVLQFLINLILFFCSWDYIQKGNAVLPGIWARAPKPLPRYLHVRCLAWILSNQNVCMKYSSIKKNYPKCCGTRNLFVWFLRIQK